VGYPDRGEELEYPEGGSEEIVETGARLPM
jgi:hypothetical protein